MWILPGPGIEPVSPALAGGFLTPGPPGKSWIFFSYWPFIFRCQKGLPGPWGKKAGEGTGKFQAARGRRVRKNEVVVDRMSKGLDFSSQQWWERKPSLTPFI